MISLATAPGLLLAAACASANAAPDTAVRRDLSATRASVAPAAASPARTSGAPSAKPAGNRPNPAAGPLRLVASVSDRELRLYQGDELVKSYTVAVGSPKYPTPRGTFNIRKLVWNPAWVPPDSKWARNKSAKAPGEKGNPMKVVKIFFKEPDYYIHGTGDTDSLGDAASHGCIRMAPGEAAEVAQYVMEHGGQPRDESWFRRIFRFGSQTKVVYLDSPVPITIAG